MAWFESLADLVAVTCDADAVELVVHSKPPISITHLCNDNAQSASGFEATDWVEAHVVDAATYTGSNLATWIGSLAVVPVVSPLAEVGWLLVAHSDTDAFDTHTIECLSRSASLVEAHLDSQTVIYELDRLGEALHASERSLAQTQARLEVSNQELEQFAYIAAHELVAPLRSVAVYAEVLSNTALDQLDGSAELGNCVTEIRSGVQRMTQQVHYLLALSKATQTVAEAQLVDTTRTALGAVDTLTDFLEEAAATVDVDPLPDVVAHDIPLQSVFANLITNAVRYRDPNRPPNIQFSGHIDDGHVVLEVTDNGRGISADAQERIFVLFERNATDGDGLGVGLAVSRRILEGFDATISARGNEQGSTFVLRFPAPSSLHRS